ncbi:PREDICTED: zinc transporter 2-like [Polistes canadensis]|uniref:zinc transporter 2-like n=1 Tax=Polistes canadensis TaxID=91411 RepID=UPI000718FAB0|nr:PREDICTED: zinc transporter 2-like [Polistes canadensis]XP_014605494.1 PREDICTED: zinc transporter 2-like [Polistes canadensis]XP_014605502.1 PREDICTED: zinc transporter 2-like [Polistes canadensis]XP_014605511.1 PREDICTED: zinc transporter 2-like [Polistes canadensis]
MDNEKIKLFKDTAIYGYGTSIPPNNNESEDEISSKKVIFCVHGKLSGCCTIVKGIDENAPPDSSILPEDHCHRERNKEIDKKARKKLLLASALCVFFMIAEIIGGVLSNSLAIATDAAHLLTDFASFMISLFSIWVAGRPPTRKMPFGWYRAEVIGALTSVLLIWVVTGILFYLAIERIINKNFELDVTVMLITSAVGVAVNLVMGLSLHQHGHTHGGHSHHDHDDHDMKKITDIENMSHKDEHKNINVRAAFIHVVGDFIQSIGVFIAALVIYFKPTWNIVDPICTFLFSILVMLTTVAIIKDVMNVLMEGMPKGFDYSQVENTFMQIEGVVKVHNLRIWALSLDKTALSAHLAIKPGTSPQNILRTATRNIHDTYNFFEMTLQIEEFNERMENCEQCKALTQ